VADAMSRTEKIVKTWENVVGVAAVVTHESRPDLLSIKVSTTAGPGGPWIIDAKAARDLRDALIEALADAEWKART
jgi:hypothetical protein